MLLKSTTRHIHIYTAEIKDNELMPSDQVLTLDVDPDNELTWSDDALQKVYRYFDDLVEDHEEWEQHSVHSIPLCLRGGLFPLARQRSFVGFAIVKSPCN